MDSSQTRKQFWKYVIPSIFSLTLTGIYCFVDAFFVGNRIGDTGLAAINISFAFISIVFALGTGIGAGSSVKYSVFKAQNNEKVAKSYIATAMTLSLVSFVIIMIPMDVFPKQILIALGASEKVAELGDSYLVINGIGSAFQIFGNAAIPIVRNCGGSITAMVSVISGCLFNTVLDWLFIWVFGWGINGAAWATVLGQVLSFIVCFAYLIKKKNISFGFKNFKKNTREIVAIGISPFGLCLVPNISVVILNKAALFYGGDPAIAAYGCMAYLVYVVYLILQGVGDGVQPLISTFHGQNNKQESKKVRNMAFVITIALAVLLFIIEFFFSRELALFMGTSEESTPIVTRGLPVMAIGFFFVGLSRTIASCLYAQECNIQSYLISYTEPLIILICILVLPKSLGLDSVWLANTIAQFFVMVISVVLLKHCDRA